MPKGQFNKRFAVGGFVGFINNSFDFDFGGGNRYPRISPSALSGDNRLDPGAGKQFDLDVSVEYKPIDPLRFSLEYTKSRLVRNDTGKNRVSTRTSSRCVRLINLLDFFSRDCGLIMILSLLISAGSFSSGYNPSPGTAFYVGYNDNFNYNGFNPYNGQLEPQFARNSRTFFIRASYLFRKSF